MDRMEAATAGEQGGVYPASAVNGNIRQHINSLNQQWVGEVEGAPGPLSVAVLVMGDDNTVHGNIRFFDSQVNRIRSFKVSWWQLMMAGCSCMSKSLKWALSAADTPTTDEAIIVVDHGQNFWLP